MGPDPGVLARRLAGEPPGTARILTPESTIWQYTHGVADTTASLSG